MRLAVAQYQQILVKLGILMALRCQNWPELSFAGDCLLPCYVCYVIKARGVPSFNVARCKTRLRDGSFFLSLSHTHTQNILVFIGKLRHRGRFMEERIGRSARVSYRGSFKIDVRGSCSSIDQFFVPTSIPFCFINMQWRA